MTETQLVPIRESRRAALARKRAEKAQDKAELRSITESSVLDVRREQHINSDGLYLPVFYSEEAKQIARSVIGRENRDMALSVGAVTSPFAGTMFGGTAALIAGEMLGTATTGLILGAAILSTGFITGGVFLSKLKWGWVEDKRILAKMTEQSMIDFSVWAKNRYGINTLSLPEFCESATAITTGVWSRASHAYVTDTKTSRNYMICSTESGALYLSLYVPNFADNGGKPTEIPTLSKALPTWSQKVLEAQSVLLVVLPSEATELYSQLVESVTRLRKQALSAEMTHQLDRTMNTVQTVLKKYEEMSELNPPKKVDEDVTEFFRNQLAFVDALAQEHVTELTKGLGVELSAAQEAIRVNSLHLTK
jgi:hypothetical protein